MDAVYKDPHGHPQSQELDVVIKATYSYTEAEIAVKLSAENTRMDPRNHCVPIIDVFAAGGLEPGLMFLTMPLLRAFNDPPFIAVEEVVEFIDQILEVSSFPSIIPTSTDHAHICAFSRESHSCMNKALHIAISHQATS